MRGSVRRRWLVVVVSTAAAAVAPAQEFDLEVLLSSGERLSQVAFTRLTPESLIVTSRTDFTDWLALDSVVEVRRENRSSLLPGVLIGGVVGGGIGYALKPNAVRQDEANLYSVAFGVVLGGVAGYVVASALQSDDVFDLRGQDRRQKHSRLKEAFGLRE